jgi:acetyl-CoA hydrolase
VGGQVDFIYGASRSKGGIPIIAVPATATIGGQVVSRIVPALKPGAGVVTTRNHVHYVVTEHGVADLYAKTIRQRARALIDVAAPEFRAELEQKAIELKYL